MDIIRVLTWDIKNFVEQGELDYSDSPQSERRQGERRSSERELAELNVGLIQADQLRAFIHMPEYELDEEAINSIDSTNVICIGVFQDTTLLSYMFFCTSPVEPQRNSGGAQFTGIGLEFSGHIRYMYKVLVMAEHRGKRLAPKMMRFAATHFNANAIDTIVTTTDLSNVSFMRFAQAMGFKQISSAAEIILAGKHWYFTPKELGNIRLSKPTNKPTNKPAGNP